MEALPQQAGKIFGLCDQFFSMKNISQSIYQNVHNFSFT
jgi:hypothetical protein